MPSTTQSACCVSTCGYRAADAYLKRAPSARQQANDKLIISIRDIHEQSGKTYGSPKIHAALNQQDVSCSLGRVKRLMRLEGIYAKLGKKYKRRKAAKRKIETTENLIIKNQLEIIRINQVYYADITFVPTSEG